MEVVATQLTSDGCNYYASEVLQSAIYLAIIICGVVCC